MAELQKALASLGYYPGGDTPGFFGAATQDAVSVYYEHLGYTPPAAGGVPMTDVIFMPSLPAKVIAVNGAKGQQPGQPFLELAARGSLALTGELPPAYAAQVKPGLKVKIFDEVTGIRAAGTIAERGDGDDDNAGRSDCERRRRLGCGELRGVCRFRVRRFRGCRVGGRPGRAILAAPRTRARRRSSR